MCVDNGASKAAVLAGSWLLASPFIARFMANVVSTCPVPPQLPLISLVVAIGDGHFKPAADRTAAAHNNNSSSRFYYGL